MTWDTQPDAITGTLVTSNTVQTFTNKTIDLVNNTLSGTLAEFNTVLSDDNFASLTGSETLTNKTLTSPTVNTPTIATPAISNPVLSGSVTGTYTLAGTPTFTSPTINTPTIATPTISAATLSGTTNLTGGQITFPATQSASANANTLDDYEESTWTPVVGGNATYTTQTGLYTKIGRVVHIQCVLTINVLGTGSASTISGLPFSAVGDGTGACMWASGAVAPTTLFAQTSTTTVLLRGVTAANASAATLNFLGNAASVTFSLTYTV